MITFFKEYVEKYKAIFSFLFIDDDNLEKSIYPYVDVPYSTSPYSVDNDKLIPINGLVALMDPVVQSIY